MEFNPRRRKTVLFVTFGLILLAIILALIAPEEKTLGSYIKLIYIHAAVTWVGLAMFAASGLVALAYIINKLLIRTSTLKESVVNWSSASQATATVFWLASVTVGSVTAYFTWGSSFWVEPRLQVALFILVLAFAVYQAGQMVSSRLLRAVLNLGLPVSVVLFLSATGKLVHPNNAFARSDSSEIKLFAGLITLVFLTVAINTTILLKDRLQAPRADAGSAGCRGAGV